MAPYLIPIFISLFFAILFIQSGLDKITDRTGNLEFYNEHFANSPLKNYVKSMLTALTIMETLCGALSALGAIFILFKHEMDISYYGAVLASLIFLVLFFGQRVSK